MNNAELTDLPELPAGAFWRISPARRGDGFMFWGPRTDTARISIMEPQELTEPKYIKIFGKKIKVGTKTTIEPREFVGKWIYAFAREEEVDVYNDDDEKIGVKMQKIENPVDSDDLTPAIILENAAQLLERYYEVKKSHKYVGDYPPKRFTEIVRENG